MNLVQWAKNGWLHPANLIASSETITWVLQLRVAARRSCPRRCAPLGKTPKTRRFLPTSPSQSRNSRWRGNKFPSNWGKPSSIMSGGDRVGGGVSTLTVLASRDGRSIPVRVARAIADSSMASPFSHSAQPHPRVVCLRPESGKFDRTLLPYITVDV